MSQRTAKLYIEDILTSINKIGKYTKNMDFNSFNENELVIDAVIRNLEVIGEAAKYLPDKIREKYPNLPWKRIIGLRNIAIHKYFSTDLPLIWKILTENIPETKKGILAIKEDLSSKND